MKKLGHEQGKVATAMIEFPYSDLQTLHVLHCVKTLAALEGVSEWNSMVVDRVT